MSPAAEPVAPCPGCGLRLPVSSGPSHPYIGASASCWGVYGQVLARSYADPVCREVLQLVVDAYACQHPGDPGRRSAQSVAIHLTTLCLVLENGADPREGPRLHRHMVERSTFSWLAPPAARGATTVASVAGAPTSTAYVDATWAWARATWEAWRPHHDVVRTWITGALV